MGLAQRSVVMKRRSFLQALAASLGAVIVEPIARAKAATTPVLGVADPFVLEIILRNGFTLSQIDIDSAMVLDIVVRAPDDHLGQMTGLRTWALDGSAASLGSVIAESIRHSSGVELTAEPIDMAFFSGDSLSWCPFDAGMVSSRLGTLFKLRNISDKRQSLVLGFAAQVIDRDDAMPCVVPRSPWSFTA